MGKKTLKEHIEAIQNVLENAGYKKVSYSLPLKIWAKMDCISVELSLEIPNQDVVLQTSSDCRKQEQALSS